MSAGMLRTPSSLGLFAIRLLTCGACWLLAMSERTELLYIRKDPEVEARLMQEALRAEKRMIAATMDEVHGELAGDFVRAALRVPDQDVNFQVSKLLEAVMRRKMKEEAPRCSVPPRATVQRPRGVIVFILVELDGISTPVLEELRHDLALALQCWSRHLPGYPLLVFHTPAVPREVLSRLAKAVPPSAGLEFAEVSVEFPPAIAADPDAYFEGRCINDHGEDRWRAARECGCKCGGMNTSAVYTSRVADGSLSAPGRCWPLAWMHSMRLATAGIFRHPVLASGRFEFIALVNADLFLVKPPPVDPFVLMKHCGCAMVYDRFSLEVPGCYNNFQEHLGKIGLAHPMIGGGLAAIGGQLLVARLSIMTSETYLAIADYLAEGIYAHRWGDQLFFVTALQALQDVQGDPAWGGPDDPALQEYSATYGVCLHDMFYELIEPTDLDGWDGSELPLSRGNDSYLPSPLLIHRRGGWRDGRIWWACSP